MNVQLPACAATAWCLPIAIAALPGVAAAQYKAPSYSTPPPRHVLRDNTSAEPIGSTLLTGPLPFNKRYAELTTEERKLFKSNYVDMPEADEPPFPANGLASLYRRLYDVQRMLLVEGELDMDVDVAPDGKARAVSVRRSPSPEITQAAAAILVFEPYKPAICSGQPCAMMFPLRVSFKAQ